MALQALPQIATNTTKAFLDFLVSKKLLKPGFQSVLGGKYLDEVDSYLLSHKLIDELALARAYSDFYGLPFIRLIDRPLKPEIAKLLPENTAQSYNALVYDLKGLDLYIAVGEPSKLQRNAPDVLIRLRQQKGLRVHLAIAPRREIETALEKLFTAAPAIKPSTLVAKSQPDPAVASSAPKSAVVKTVEERAKTIDLSDVKINPETLNKIPESVAKKYQIIVFDSVAPKSKFEPALIKVAAVNPDDIKVREILGYIESRNKVLVDRYRTEPQSFEAAVKLYLPADKNEQAEIIDEQPEKPVAPKPDQSAEVNKAREPVERTPTIPVKPSAPASSQAPTTQPTSDAEKPTNDGETPQEMVLSPADIINRPSEETSTEELQRLAKEQEVSLENQNLDRLLKGEINSVEDLSKVFKDGRIPEIVAATLFLAIRMKASDVHIEAEKETVRLRYRVDGILHDIIRVPHFLHAPLISRIKILSKMKIDEQRIPQDGRFDVIIDNRQVDLRVSTLPTVHGEKIVMRLLDKSEGILTLEQLGVTGTNFDRLIENINKPYGIILSTGPTGSGKSTTLYAILNRISKPGVNIITLEDPVEYELPGLNQAQVKPGIGFTFAEGLRSVLRQDPNVIMVGEVRDLETAAMATHAALTGHLVLSTLHTNDASGALPRMINMGVEPFLITSSINAVIGQRLVRKVCDDCKEKAVVPPAVLSFAKRQLEALPTGKLKNINLEELVFYHGTGCTKCTDGYRGRIGIYEVLTMNEKIESLAVSKAPASEIKKAAISSGMITMTQDGLIKALKGITTIDEVLRVTTTEIKELPQ